jgi:hypothetical protein
MTRLTRKPTDHGYRPIRSSPMHTIQRTKGYGRRRSAVRTLTVLAITMVVMASYSAHPKDRPRMSRPTGAARTG